MKKLLSGVMFAAAMLVFVPASHADTVKMFCAVKIAGGAVFTVRIPNNPTAAAKCESIGGTVIVVN